LAFVVFKDVTKIYGSGDAKTIALDGASFSIADGKFCVIVGPSGAGKTTLLNILGGIDRCTSGEITVGNKKISDMNETGLTTYRRHDVGFVFQFYNLVQNLTALENVELASEICKSPLDPVHVIKEVGLDNRMDNFPAQLSGGEQQRVAIARAVAKNPKILLCDEPTGALDEGTGRQILDLLRGMTDSFGVTVILITHNTIITEMADIVISLRNGEIVSVIENDEPKSAADIAW